MDNKKLKVVIALMLSTFLAAFEGTVVTTAMPTIATDLKGYELISWIFSAYLLTSAVSTPIYGKFSDLYGRKKILSIGIIIFLIGSSLCGLSQTIVQLIIFRAIQGLGAGSILTVTFTIVGDLFDLSQKVKIQGWLSTVWGIASLIGPLIGGFLLDTFSWHWIFFINIPFGLISIIMLNNNLDEIVINCKPKIDYIGCILLTISIISLLFGALGKSVLIITICALITIVSLIMFYYIEKRAEEPLVPFNIFSKTTIVINLICFVMASLLTAIESYTPLYTQNVLGLNATLSGLCMAPMSVTWLLSSFILSRALPKYGEKKIIQIALFILFISTIILRFLNVSTPIIYLLISVIIMGLGFGGIFNSSTIVVQSAVEKSERGVSTSTNTLIRTLGQTIGVSIFGGVLNSGITSYFSKLGISNVTPDNIINSQEALNISNIQIKEAFFTGIHNIFIVLIFLVIICFILSLIMPKKSRVKL